MSFYRFQCSVPTDSGLAEDRCINTYHFISDDVGTELQEITDIVAQALTPIYNAVDAYLSENVASPLTYTGYDMEDSPPRVPIVQGSIALTPGVAQLPNQMAAQVQLRGDIQSGQNRKRLRGRVFFGPLGTFGIEDTAGDMGLTDGMRNAVGGAFAGIIPSFLGITSLSTIRLCVFSVSDALGLAIGQPHPVPEPDFTSAQLGAGYKPVVEVAIGNRMSSLRRRRTRPTSTLTYT